MLRPRSRTLRWRRLLGCLGSGRAEVLEANAADLADERAEGLTAALRDRLTLSEARVAAMAEGVRAVAALGDPVGEELEHRVLASGLDLTKVRVPLGVVAVVYEARPNVTIDCAALTIKSGNAIVLRGSSYAERTNGALAAIVREALAEAGLPEDAVLLLAGGGREDLAELATQEGTVDLLIPRGGEGLKNALKDVATVPVIYAAAGNCHVYVHADADLGDGAADRASTRRPSAPASATPPRRCWSTPRSPRTSCPPRSPSCARPGSSWSATSGRARAPAGSRSALPARRTGRPSTST